MSLHIESTENALAELKKQRTKTLTAAISVSFLGIALMGLLLYLVHIIVAVPEDPPMVAYATQEGDNPDIDTPEVTQTTQRPSSSSTSAQVKVIAAVATADSTRYTLRAPASMTASMTLRSSTPVTLLGTVTSTRGLKRLNDVTRESSSLSMSAVMS